MLLHAHEIGVRASWTDGAPDDVQCSFERCLLVPPACLSQRRERVAVRQVVAVKPALFLHSVVVQEPYRGACESESKVGHVTGRIAPVT